MSEVRTYRFGYVEGRRKWYTHWIGDVETVLTLDPPADLISIRREGGLIIFKEKYPYDAEIVEAVLNALHDNPNVMLYGPPGTGKTTMASFLCEYFAPFTHIVVVESALIPSKFGVNPFEKLRRYHCIVIDDFLILGAQRKAEELKHSYLVMDIQNFMREFLDYTRAANIFVLITTNLVPDAIEEVIRSRTIQVKVPLPSERVKEKLKELGYKIHEGGKSFREMLWGVSRDVIEIPPREPPRTFQMWNIWSLYRPGVFKAVCNKCRTDLPREIVIAAAGVLSAVMDRPAVWLRNPYSTDKLYIYERPIVVMDELVDSYELRRMAFKYDATLLVVGNPQGAEIITIDQIVDLICPDTTPAGMWSCFKKMVEEMYEGAL